MPGSPIRSPLRARRKELGLTLEAASDRTGIPAEHLQALEDGRVEDLPAGPYRQSWEQTYRRALGLPPPVDTTPSTPGRPVDPLWLIRGFALFTAMILGGVLLYQVVDWMQQPGPPPVSGPDQQVTIEARRNTTVKVVVDGEVVVDRRLAGGEVIEVEGEDRIEVDLAATGHARVEYNGERVVPLGAQDSPRRLVFIDDME